MNERVITNEIIGDFKNHLILEERSTATIEKYIRDVTAFVAYVGDRVLSKKIVIAYKEKLKTDGYAARSINSMLASINALFAYMGWHEFRVKTIKLQQQIFWPEEKELTKAEYMRL